MRNVQPLLYDIQEDDLKSIFSHLLIEQVRICSLDVSPSAAAARAALTALDSEMLDAVNKSFKLKAEKKKQEKNQMFFDTSLSTAQ